MTSLLALLDDIATTLDDVAVMTKVATKKTTGILGDDLALNAEQLVGIDSKRELSIIKSVVKGSLLNKLILVPLALALNFYLPFVLKILLLIGGLYLAFEGIEKVVDKLFHKKAEKEVKIVSEKDKVKGAVRTDFILSAEIIVIALSTMLDKPFWLQATVLSMVALTVTFFIQRQVRKKSKTSP